jgi:alkylated DNA repair dioxygenase AlkB
MINLLPYDGVAYYYGKMIADKQADHFYDSLLQNIEWKQEEAIIYGRRIITKRKVAWYGDKAYAYTYSSITKEALPWTAELVAIKQIAEEQNGDTFNSCLLNLYHNGEEGMGWHSDNETSLQSKATIVSFSFGAERKISFKHKSTNETVSLLLEHGSLLIMKDITQTHWLHSLPKSKKVSGARINLTFRSMKE